MSMWSRWRDGGIDVPSERPTVIVLGGVNGAGKTTSAQKLLADRLGVRSFTNADEIARGLSGFAPERAAVAAGRIMLQRLNELARERVDFAFESTLSGRAYLAFLRNLRESGYAVEVYYLWLRSADLAITRVRQRVLRGGHNIPEETIRRRYGRSIQNFWTAYRREADSWFVYDNSGPVAALVAAGTGDDEAVVGDPGRWAEFLGAVHAEKRVD
jgi:predicted ABC-type ATPase